VCRTKFITKRHVQAIQKQFYTPNIIDVEQLNQPPLRPSFLMLYASQFQLNMLRQYRYPDQLYVDGTFKCVPPETKLVATALLRSKKTEDYGSMWASISSLVKQFLEKQIIINCDFEKSHHNAIQNQFGPRATIIGCFFHLLQAGR
jgi:hypothetical protein